MYSSRLQYSVSCAHMPSGQQSETSTLSKKSVRSVVILPAQKALVRLYRALLTGLIHSSPMPLPPAEEPKTQDTSAPRQLTYDPPAPKTIHPAFRKRDSDEWSDDDPKTQNRFARFFPDDDPALAGYKSLPSEVAIKLTEADERFSRESQRSLEERRSYDSNAEVIDLASIYKQKRQDSALSTNTVEDDVQIAKAVPLRRAVRKSFYPPPRPISK